MAQGAVGLHIDRVNVVEVVAIGFELLQLLAAALRQNDVAQVAIGGNHLLSIRSRVIAVVATEASGRNFVADVVRVNPPVGFHFREKIRPVNLLRRRDQPVNAGQLGIARAEAGRDFLHGPVRGFIGPHQNGHEIGLQPWNRTLHQTGGDGIVHGFVGRKKIMRRSRVAVNAVHAKEAVF